MSDCRAKLGNNGRVVIPAEYRKRLHLVPGEDLVLRLEKNGLHLMSLKQSIKQAQAKVKKHNPHGISLVDSLKQTRLTESENE